MSEDWAFLGPRVAVVSRHVPARDGIARYADQLCAMLARDREVLRLGIAGGGGDVIVEAWGGFKPLRLLRAARGWEDVLVQYHASYFLQGGFVSRLASYLSLAVLARALPATWVVHEPDDPLPDEVGRRGRIEFAAQEWLRRRFWSGAKRLVFHTSAEREAFAARFPARRREALLADHGAHFEPASSATRAEARDRLGLPADAVLLVAPGFLSPHKGVEEVVSAAEEAGGVELHIVGEPIAPYPHVLSYVEELRGAVAASPSAHLHERFVSDEEFDLWIRAADAVVAGYRTAASSSVAARARLLGARLLTSGAGGLAEQAGERDVVFSSREELVQAIRQLGLRSSPRLAP